MRPRPSRLVVGLFLTALALAAAQVAGSVAVGMTMAEVAAEYILAAVLAGVSFGVIGFAILGRYPRHTVGWTLLVLAVYGQLQSGVVVALRAFSTGDELASGLSPLATFLVVFNNAGWLLVFFGVMVWVPLHFPDGRLPSPRWRWVAAGSALVVSGATLVFALASASSVMAGRVTTVDQALGDGAASPAWEPALEIAVMLFAASLLPALMSLVVRYRSSDVIARLQIRWVVVSVGITVLATPVLLLFRGYDPTLNPILIAVVVQLIPLSIGVAILRYRLFDLDRLLGRSITYLLLSGLLALVYVGSVLAISTVLGSSGERPPALAVAAATLAAVVAFNPLRTRVQSAIDRRLFRSRANAHEAVEALSDRLRDRVQVEDVMAEVSAVVDEVVAPTTIAVWARDVAVTPGHESAR